MKIDRGFVVAALPLGPLEVLAGHMALLASGAVISDLMLCARLVFPSLLLVAAAVAAVWRRDVARWVSMAIGAAVGTVGVAALVVGGISAIAWMISDLG